MIVRRAARHRRLSPIRVMAGLDPAIYGKRGAASEVGGDRSKDRAVRTLRHHIDPAAAHPRDGMSNGGCQERRGWPGQARP